MEEKDMLDHKEDERFLTNRETKKPSNMNIRNQHLGIFHTSGISFSFLSSLPLGYSSNNSKTTNYEIPSK